MVKSWQVSAAKKLKIDQTEAERKLWSKLRSMQINGIKFRRQQPIENYIVDFVSFEKRLIIEVDGGQHYFGEVAEADKIRDKYLENQGLKVLRFSDTDVLKNIDGVLERIFENINHLE